MPLVKPKELSQRQKDLINLYKRACGYAVVWKSKSGQIRVIDPHEISILNSNNWVDLLEGK